MTDATFSHTDPAAAAVNRVPQATPGFWLIKLTAVTMGETAADFLIQSAIQRHLSEVLTVSALSVRRDEGLLEITLSYVLRDSGETVTDSFRHDAGAVNPGGHQ